jgi:lysophospholipase L1-like esterase
VEEGVYRRVAVLAVVTALFGAVFAGPAAAARRPVTSPPLVAGSTYLALGDSVTFGYQESNVIPKPNYANARSFLAYPEHIARELKVKVVNAACPGETTASLINNHAESNGCENILGVRGGYRTMWPLHVRYSGSQLAFAVHYLRAHHNVRLVSLMIGANDAFICQETTADHCGSTSEINALLSKIARHVRHILSVIRKQAHYHGQLVILNYYSTNYASPTANLDSQALNNDVDTAAKPFRVEIADGYGSFAAQALKFGNSTCAAGLLTQWQVNGTPTCGVHPSYAGQALLAEAVLRAVRL